MKTLKELKRNARFTITISGERGRPKIVRTDNPAVAWEVFANHARVAASVTLHDDLTDVEVEA